MPTEFSARLVGGIVVAAGEIDLATVPVLRAAMEAAARHAPVVVDLSQVSYLDSAGIAVLFEHARTSLELVVVPGSSVARILEITGLAQAVTCTAPGS